MKQYSLFGIKPDIYYDKNESREDLSELKIPLPNPEEFIQEIKDLLLENSFEIIAEKKYQVSREIAGRHYEEHIGKFKPGYEESVYDFTRRYLSSGYSYWIVFYGENAVVKGREILTEIRTKYLVNPKVARYNMTHASDSEAGAKREIQIHFPDFEF